MPAILLSFLPLLAKYAPDLIGMAFGGGASEVAARVEGAVRDIFGTTDPVAVQQQVDTDPSKADQLKARLDAETTQVQAYLADTQNARATQVEYVKASSLQQWVAPIWTVMISAGFIAMLFLLVIHPIDFTANQATAINILFGVLTAEFSRCGSFWLGTTQSAGKRVDQALNFAAAAPTPTKRR